MNGQKTGGRQKGTPNKMTAEKREFLGNLLSDNYELIQQDFLNLDSYQRCNIMVKILPYIMPKVQPVSETEEQKRAAEQLKLYSNLADKVFFWEQQRQKQLQEQEEQQKQQQMQQEEAKQDPCLNSSILDNESNPTPGSTQPSNIKPQTNLNPSTLDDTTPPCSVGGASETAQSAGDAPSLNPSTLENTDTHTEISEEDEETDKILKLQVYHQFAPLLDETAQAEMAYYLMKKHKLQPHELLINGKLPLKTSTLENTAQTSKKGDAPCPTQSASETQILNPSTLDNVAQVSRVSEDSDTVQSEEQKPTLAKTNLRPYKQQQHRPFYAAIANKRRR